jgi:2-alkenal reductase
VASQAGAAAGQAEASEASAASELEAKLIAVYAAANPSVVSIQTSAGATGSGYVYAEGGYIVTNYHVVAGARQIEVDFADGSAEWAEVVGTDAANDLAVLQVSEVPAGAVPLALATGEVVRVGQLVVAIGSPYGEQGSMSFGIVSGLDRTLTSSSGGRRGTVTSLTGLIQTDAPINPGNSGGPLLNLAGEVIGINTAIESLTGTGSGVGFAIPAETIQAVVLGVLR